MKNRKLTYSSQAHFEFLKWRFVYRLGEPDVCFGGAIAATIGTGFASLSPSFDSIRNGDRSLGFLD